MTEATDVGPLASPGFWLRRAAFDWLATLEATLAPHDLTPTQFALLAGTNWLTRAERGRSQQELADFTSTDRSTASRVLRTLEGRGLVERVPNTNSGRALVVRTTRPGPELAVLVAPLARATDREFFGGVADYAELRSTLQSLCD